MTESVPETFHDLPRDSDGLATTPAALSQLEERLSSFLDKLVADAGAERLVVGLDGGIETTLAATLAVDTLGQDAVIGLVMPAFMSHEATARNAETVATALGIDHSRLQLQPVLAVFQEAVGEPTGPTDDLVATNNALSRVRMACAYYVANTMDALVVGTVNRTEYLLGSITKHGDTGADCLLFANLYRSEVQALAEGIGIPPDIIAEQVDGRYEGESVVSELQIEPKTIDRILRLHVDKGEKATTVADKTDVDPSLVQRLFEWCTQTRHKRNHPPTSGQYLNNPIFDH